jgi:ring-1,2-phenylacetyl-CoA epoxidase subunit PaaC
VAEDDLRADLAEYCLRLGDDRLVLGHRLSEWCGHLPIVEEELALGNVALDLLDQANLLLDRAGLLEARGRTADALAFFRGVREFRNLLLVEQPNGDFACTIVRQFLFDVFDLHLGVGLESSRDRELAVFGARGAKEASYHLRHSREWILRLGDGTDDSHRRMQAGLDGLWTFTGELFAVDDLVGRLVAAGIAVDPERLRAPWREEIAGTLREAGLDAPSDDQGMRSGGRIGRHGEVLDRMLCEMQIVARSFPGASW